MRIIGKDFDDVFKQVCNKLYFSEMFSPRGQQTKELINATYVIENPINCILTNPNRNISKNYLKQELGWYLSGDLSAKEIQKYAKIWGQIADENGNVNSNYGYYIWHQKTNNLTQIQWVIDALLDDPDTRQALININQPIHKYKGNKDFVCTISTQYFIRKDKLHCIVNMRSQDFVFGAGNDVPFFVFVQYEILKELQKTYPNLELGRLETNCGSLHIYERHFNMLQNIVDDSNEYESESLFVL